MPEHARGARLRPGTSVGAPTTVPARAASVLVVGGLDPSGGAGVGVDEVAVHAQDCACDVVLSARTDQDDREVRAVGARNPGDWFNEALELFLGRVDSEGVGPGRALKFGLLPGEDQVRGAAHLVKRLRECHPSLSVVVDPVLASSSGHEFLDASALAALRAELVPLGVVLTPNLPEAVRLVGAGERRLAAVVADPSQRLALMDELLGLGARGIVLKGGHGMECPARDLVAGAGTEPVWVTLERVEGPGIRGSGCRHASVLACGLALGEALPVAAKRAANYVGRCIRAVTDDS